MLHHNVVKASYILPYIGYFDITLSSLLAFFFLRQSRVAVSSSVSHFSKALLNRLTCSSLDGLEFALPSLISDFNSGCSNFDNGSRTCRTGGDLRGIPSHHWLTCVSTAEDQRHDSLCLQHSTDPEFDRLWFTWQQFQRTDGAWCNDSHLGSYLRREERKTSRVRPRVVREGGQISVWSVVFFYRIIM